MSFVAVFKGGHLLKENLEDFLHIPHIVFVLQIITNNKDGYFYNTYVPTNLDGTKKIIKAGNFEIIDIESSDNRWSEGITIIVSENEGQNIYYHRTLSLNMVLFIDELKYLCEVLSSTGSWQRFLNLNKAIELEEENNTLKKAIAKKDQEILKLTGELKDLSPR